MSVVTNLILSYSSVEYAKDRLNDVNSFEYEIGKINFVSIDYEKDMEKRTAWYGGNKFFEGNIFIAAFNHFPLDKFVDHLKAIKWDAPEWVQLFVKEENDDKFRIIELI